MAVASKILNTIDIPCEMLHPWATCCDASAGLFIHTIQNSFRIYVITYTVLIYYIISKIYTNMHIIFIYFKLDTYVCLIYLFYLVVDSTDERSKAHQEGTQTNPVEHFTVNCFSVMQFMWFLICCMLTEVLLGTMRNYTIVWRLICTSNIMVVEKIIV